MNAAVRLVEVRVPDMGNFKDVAIIDVLVKPGETIEPETPLVTLETEKATMDVPSTVGGVIEKIHVTKGGTVSPGDLVVTVRSEGAPAEGSAADATSGAGSSGQAAAPAAADGAQQTAGSPTGTYSTAPDGQPPATGEQSSPGAAGPGARGAVGAAAATGSQIRSPASSTVGAPPQAAAFRGASAQGAAAQGAVSQGPSSGGATGQGAAGPGGAAQGASGQAPAQAVGTGAHSAPGQRAPASQGAGTPPVAQSGSGAGQSAARLQPDAGKPAAGVKTETPPFNEPGFSRAHAGPSVRRFARELGVDLTQVKGGGFKGRVTHDDVKAFVKKSLADVATAKSAPVTAPAAGRPTGLPAIPAIDFSQFGPIETKPLSRIQKISGPRLHASWVNIPHVTQFDEADITDLEDLRTRLKQKALQEGIKLTPLAFVLRACVKAMQEFPLFNASLDAAGTNLVMKKYLNVGFAADTPNGLVVPVVREANRKDVYELARQLGELSEKARGGKLTSSEMQGGCFTISSLGGIGGTAFTPIINAPEVAILGVSRSAMRPIFRDGAFVPRLILPLSLSYDHRVIDGALAARFTTFLAQTLADPRGLTEAVP